ncbi:restriction endonuclease subunit S [Belliella pelovolcani]|uniref:Type I restriction enzyme, S subunit n=1 Tax=Belliella pelovolcani TaxID=529505 RepID=A0A1N7PM81_9BACT|nr:restriction endonuclease subunit S [Belliella pelovolcani]SIT11734.1 type I restriction enzyme, S subunit [Belliella pelovolcani]
MRESYQKLGNYIQPVVGRNTELRDIPLMGLSINKVFFPSIANTIGTNMGTYRIIKRNQFGYGPVTSRNGEKITIALFKDHDEALISQAYTPFEVKDKNKLDPEYLMMWFRRPEFDRYARFKSHGSAREIFSWDEMCDVMLPIPSIEKQREIVAEYQAIEQRIQINQKLIEKLEETAQAIYREWFVEFENYESTFLEEYIETNPKLELKKGELTSYIEMANLSETSMCINGKTERGYQGGSRFQNEDILLARITPCLENGKTAFVNILNPNEVAAGSTEFIVMRAKKNISPYWVYCLAKDDEFRAYAISSMIGSSGRQRVHEKYLEEYSLPKIDPQNMIDFHKSARPIFETVKLKSKENQKLTELKELVLAKMAQSG